MPGIGIPPSSRIPVNPVCRQWRDSNHDRRQNYKDQDKNCPRSTPDIHAILSMAAVVWLHRTVYMYKGLVDSSHNGNKSCIVRRSCQVLFQRYRRCFHQGQGLHHHHHLLLLVGKQFGSLSLSV